MTEQYAPIEEARAEHKLADEGTPELSNIMRQAARQWRWIAVSAVVCVAIAWFIGKRQQPVYEREELVLVVRNDGTQGTEIASAFQSFGLFQADPEKRTELYAISAPSVMMEVVRRLNLNVDYTTPDKWYRRTLYGSNQPIMVSFPGWPDEAVATMSLELRPSGKLVITELVNYDAEGEKHKYDDLEIAVDYTKGDTIKTPIGLLAFAPNPIYSGEPVTEPMELDVKRSSIYSTTMALSSSLKSDTPDEWADIIALSITNVSTQRAEDILNTIVSVYNEDWVRERSRVANATSRFINDRLNVIEQELGEVDSDIAGYKSANLVPDIQTSATMYVEKANRTSEELLELTNRLAMTRYVREFMASSANANAVLPANTGVADINIENQIAEYNRTLMERNSLAANSSTSNPLVSDLDSRLKGMRGALVQSLDNTIKALNTSITSLERSENASTSKIASTPTQARYLLSVERQQKVKEALYLYLLQKREENELAQNYVTNKVRIISQPMGSPTPVAPKKMLLMLVGLFIGLLIPIAVIAIRHLTQTTIRSRRDLDTLKVPFVGEIPLNINSTSRMARLFPHHDTPQGIVVEPENLNIINEAFRVLRTNFELMTRHKRGEGRATVASVTSASPGSGKTFITANLAKALAIKGNRVLIIDLDLRRAAMTEDLLGHDNSALGVINYLVGNASLDNVITRNIDNIADFDLLPVGIIPPNPTELLEDSRMAQMIEQLRSHYDYIFLDCPPIDIVADTLIINNLSDITLFVVRAGLFQREMLPRLQELYDTKRYRNIAIVLNGTTESSNGYGYRYKYGYYHHYSHRARRAVKR